jgi:molybdate transport system regulatory protein
MNNLFTGPLVIRTRGGGSGGGAALTPLGETVLRLYSRMEAACETVTQPDWRTLQALLKA